MGATAATSARSLRALAHSPLTGQTYRHYSELPSVPGPIATHYLWRVRMYDRTPGAGEEWLTPDEYAALRADVAANGVREPVVLDWCPSTGEAHLCEGNHRVAIARELGIETLATIAISSSPALMDRHRQSVGADRVLPLTAPYLFEGHELPGSGGLYDPSVLWSLVEARDGHHAVPTAATGSQGVGHDPR